MSLVGVRLTPVLLIALIAGSCTLLSSDQDRIANKEDLYEGVFEPGIEDYRFRPCANLNESWMFSQNTETRFYQQLWDVRNETEEPLGNVYLRLKGVPSEKGGVPDVFYYSRSRVCREGGD